MRLENESEKESMTEQKNRYRGHLEISSMIFKVYDTKTEKIILEVPAGLWQAMELPLELPEVIGPILHTGIPVIERNQLPRRREGKTFETKIQGVNLYLRTGEYDDGQLGEIFIDMFKEGGGYRALLNCFAIAVSLGLQYGIPLEVFIEKFIGVKFEPCGRTDNPDVKECGSIIDYIFKVVEREYLKEGQEHAGDTIDKLTEPEVTG